MNQRAVSRGLLIAVEGCDRVGKSTHCDRIVKALLAKDVKAELLQFPNRKTPVGSLINKYLQGEEKIEDHAVHLLFSANRWEMVPHMMRRLEEGVTLVLDRYAYSGVAYTAAKPGFEIQWCMNPDVGLPKPDLVIFMNLDTTAASQRNGFGDECYEVPSFQSLVKDNFLKLAEENWQIVEANDEPDVVHSKIMKIVSKTLLENQHPSLEKLWTNKTNERLC